MEVIAMPDYIIREGDKQRAIERWENEGGRSIYADFIRACERERNDARPSDRDTAVGARHVTGKRLTTLRPHSRIFRRPG
jgi:hypothetical protein